MPAPGSADRLRAFVAAARRRHASDLMLRVLVGVGAACGIGVLAVSWWRPAWFAASAVAAASVLALALLLALLRARSLRLGELLARLPVATAATLADGLATWCERDALARSSEPMTQWLGDDLDVDLGALPPAQVRQSMRRRLGRARYLLPLFVLLFVTWLLWQLWPPPVPGVLTGLVPPPPAGGGSGGDGPGNGASSPEPKSAEPRPQRDLPRPPPPEPEPPPSKVEPKPAPPAPLLQAESEQQFVVPQFLGDGPSRRALVQAAETDGGGSGSAPPPPSPPQAGAEPPPLLQQHGDEQFERAIEAALRSRHVPPAERPMVERFFRELRERGQQGGR